MSATQETVRYWGETEAERQAAFKAEAESRAADGWRVVRETTDWPVGKPGLDLVVTYERVAPGAAPEGATGKPPRRWSKPFEDALSGGPRTVFWRILPYLGVAAFVIAACDFVLFWLESAFVGDATTGYQSGGHYFVSSKLGFKEVGREAWQWLRFQQSTSIPVFYAGFAGGFIGVFVLFEKRLTGQVSPAEREARVSIVKHSGPLLASATAMGSVADVSIGFPVLKARVYPGGHRAEAPFRCGALDTGRRDTERHDD